MDWVDVAMEEYKTLRQEVQTSISAQQTILSFGTATLGLVFGAGVNLWEKELAPVVLFSLVIPLLSGLVLLIWLSEAMRMVRAGNYLSVLEKDIAAAGKADGRWGDVAPLRWECRLRPGNELSFGQFVLGWPAVFQTIGLVGLVSIVIGFFNDVDQGHATLWPFGLGAMAVAFLVIVGSSARRRWQSVSKALDEIEREHAEVRPANAGAERRTADNYGMTAEAARSRPR